MQQSVSNARDLTAEHLSPTSHHLLLKTPCNHKRRNLALEIHLWNVTKKYSKGCLPLLDCCHTASPESIKRQSSLVPLLKHKLENQCTEYAAASICEEKTPKATKPPKHHLKAEQAKDVTDCEGHPPKKHTCNHCRAVSVHTSSFGKGSVNALALQKV